MRGAFVFYGYKLLHGNDDKAAIEAAKSVELIHTALLMHDDIMDEDDTRRGLPTTHEFYKIQHLNKAYRFDAKHWGESMAINVGDIALLSGYEILTKSHFPVKLRLEVLDRMLRGIINTGLGQAYDILLEARGVATEKDILNLHYAKTGIYTYENPLHVGAILAGGSEDDLATLSTYAIPGGIAFQIQDDILGLFGDPQKTGKPAHSDLRQGKMTLLIVKALKSGSPKQVKRLKQIWGKRDLTADEAQEIRKIVIDTGSLDYSRKISIQYAKKAQAAIAQMVSRKWNSEAISYLDGIVQYMIERDM